MEVFYIFVHQNSEIMRINLKTTSSQMCIPFNYQPKLVGTLHKWLGPNDIHGKLAMHSFSWLMGGSTTTQPDPDLSNCEFFKIGSPVFIQRRLEDGSNKHYTYEDTVAGNLLEETLRHKMQVAGLPDDRTLKISFATEYPKKKIKTIYYNGIGNRTSWCPVRIQGKPETKVFAWATGIGNSTGAGFGSIY